MSHTVKCETVKTKDKRNIKGAVDELRAKGLDVEYAENVQPRLYYPDQLQTQNNQPNEICEVVVKVNDGFYDVGFVRDKDGNLIAHFDDFEEQSGHARAMKPASKMTSKVIGQDNATHGFQPIGKLMQAISKHAGITAAQRDGWTVTGSMVDDDGKVHLKGMKA